MDIKTKKSHFLSEVVYKDYPQKEIIRLIHYLIKRKI